MAASTCLPVCLSFHVCVCVCVQQVSKVSSLLNDVLLPRQAELARQDSEQQLQEARCVGDRVCQDIGPVEPGGWIGSAPVLLGHCRAQTYCLYVSQSGVYFEYLTYCMRTCMLVCTSAALRSWQGGMG